MYSKIILFLKAKFTELIVLVIFFGSLDYVEMSMKDFYYLEIKKTVLLEAQVLELDTLKSIDGWSLEVNYFYIIDGKRKEAKEVVGLGEAAAYKNFENPIPLLYSSSNPNYLTIKGGTYVRRNFIISCILVLGLLISVVRIFLYIKRKL